MKVGITLLYLTLTPKQQERIYLLWQPDLKKKVLTLWTITRALWPLKPQTPYAATHDGSLLIEYQNALDPLDVLTYVVSNTNKITLGTSVIDMFFHTPIMLAKRFAHLMSYHKEDLSADLVLVGQRTSIKLLIFHLKAEDKERINLFKY